MERRYTVHLPFRLSPTQKIQDGSKHEWSLMSRQATLNGLGERATITVVDLHSESEASEYLNRLATGLMWAAVEMACGVLVSTELEEVTYLDAPVEPGNPNGIPAGTEAFANDGACVYPDGAKLVFFALGTPTVFRSAAGDRFANLLTEGATLSSSPSPWEDPRTRLAFEFFSSSFFESSVNARFVALISVLEALKEQPDRSDDLLGLMDRWQTDLDTMRRDFGKDGRDSSSIDALQSGLVGLRRESIGYAIRALVIGLLGDARRAEEAMMMYKLRSELLHGNQVTTEAVRGNLGTLEAIVRDVLRARLLHPVNATPSL